MFYTDFKSTSSGYVSPDVKVVEIMPEGMLAASVGVGTPSINDMPEWNGWEE
jgi:hypothetical protein